MSQIGNKLVRKQRVVESLFKRTKKSLGESKGEYRKLSNYLEVGKDKLDRSPEITERQLNKLKNLKLGDGGVGGDGNSGNVPGPGLLGTLLFGAQAVDTIRNIRNFAKGIGKRFFGKNATKVTGNTTAKSVSNAVTKETTEKVTQNLAEKGVTSAAKNVTKEGLEAASKTVAKEGLEKVATKGGSKLLAKKIPLVGLVLGTAFAVDRAAKGDMAGAAMEFLSGAASTVPGWGTAASVAIDAALIGKDVKEAVDDASAESGDSTEKTSNTNVSSVNGDVMNVNYEPQSTMLELRRFDESVNLFGEKFAGTITADNFMSSIDQELGSASASAGITELSGDGSLSGDGTFNTGLKTGKSEYIGGSADYHIDSQFKSSLSMEEKVKMMDQLAAGYAAQGRNIEFSNNAVANTIWDSNASYEDKAALLQRAFEAHQIPRGRAIDAAGFNRIDYYAPLIKDSQETAGKGRFRDSVVGQDILIPTLGGNAVDYSSGGNYGAFVEVKDKDGNIIFRTGHGDIRGAKSGSVPLEVEETTKNDAASVTTETPPTDIAKAVEGQLRKVVKPATSVRGKDKIVYQRFDGEQWMTGTGETAAQYEYLYNTQEYLRSPQGIANEGAGRPLQITTPSGESMFTVPSTMSDSTNMVSQYTSYNNPSKSVNNTTLISMGVMPGNKQPMVVQAPGGGSSTTFIPSSDMAAALNLQQVMLFNKLVS